MQSVSSDQVPTLSGSYIRPIIESVGAGKGGGHVQQCRGLESRDHCSSVCIPCPVKTKPPRITLQFQQTLSDFQNSFTGRLSDSVVNLQQSRD